MTDREKLDAIYKLAAARAPLAIAERDGDAFDTIAALSASPEVKPTGEGK